MNIKNLSIWPDLVKIGFEPITYSFNGKVIHTGASLRKQLTDISGNIFYTDIITIEPHSYSDRKNYHISGEVNTPYFDTLYRYEYGSKVSFFQRVTNINTHIKAGEILNKVALMLK